MFIDKFKILASIAEAVKKVVDEEDVEESGLRKAAYAAHSAGQSHFKFKGKTYPVKITKEHVDEMKEEVKRNDTFDKKSHQYITTMKHAKNPTVQQRMAAHDIKPGVAGYRDRIDMLKDLEKTGKLKKEHVDEMKESAEHDLQEGDAPSDYPTTARAANAASKTAKSKKEHIKAYGLHTRAAKYALSTGDTGTWLDHMMTAKEHRLSAEGLKEATGVTDYNPPSQGGTRKELTAKYHKTKDPKDAEAARKAGATQNELKGKLSEEEIKESDPLRARYSLPVTTVPYGYKRDWSPEGARKRQLRPDKNVPELKNAIKNTLGQHGPKGKLPEESNLDDESPIAEVKKPTGGLKKACWKGYTAVGMKSKGGRMVPNCVPEEVEEDTSIDEKAVNPYAVGMAAAKKSAGVTKTHDLPKSVITKGHEIAKKIIKKG